MLESNNTEVLRKKIIEILIESNCYIDNELPDYIMVMIANKKTLSQMKEDLKLFIGSNVGSFVNKLTTILDQLNCRKYCLDENQLILKANLSGEITENLDKIYFKQETSNLNKIVFNENKLEEDRNNSLENNFLDRKKRKKKKIVFNTDEFDDKNNSVEKSNLIRQNLNVKSKEKNLIEKNLINLNSSYKLEKNNLLVKPNKLIIKAIEDANRSTLNLNNDLKNFLITKRKIQENQNENKKVKIVKAEAKSFTLNNNKTISNENKTNLHPFDLRHILLRNKKLRDSQALNSKAKSKYEIINERLIKFKKDRLLQEKLLKEKLSKEQDDNVQNQTLLNLSKSISYNQNKYSKLKNIDTEVQSSHHELDNLNKFKKDLTSTNKKERCYFWPICQYGDKCTFHHPKSLCMQFPSCKFKESCLNIHPNCKFDSRCNKKDCPYTHYSKKLFLTKPKKLNSSLLTSNLIKN